MGNTVRQLQIPESVDDALAIKGFAPALCRTLAAIACYDGGVTLAEYGALASSANALGNVSDNKVLMNNPGSQGAAR